MSFQWAQNWILPWEEDNCPATRQNPFTYLQERTVCMAINSIQLAELYQDRQIPQVPTCHPQAAHSKV